MISIELRETDLQSIWPLNVESGQIRELKTSVWEFPQVRRDSEDPTRIECEPDLREEQEEYEYLKVTQTWILWMESGT